MIVKLISTPGAAEWNNTSLSNTKKTILKRIALKMLVRSLKLIFYKDCFAKSLTV
jgi:hypothetical protein